MGIPSTVDPSPKSGTPPRRARLTAWWAARPPLARDIAAILLVKAIALWLIWYACFREPIAPHMAMDPSEVAARLAGSAPSPELKHAVD